jgi:N-acetyl-gamma-glutamyl-phosphate reductase
MIDMEGIKILVPGGESGKAGKEAVEILENHPYVDAVIPCGRELPSDEVLEDVDAAIVALRHGFSGDKAAHLHALGKWVADLSGDLRLDSVAEYERWYKLRHPAPELIEGPEQIPYSLPELYPEKLEGRRLVSIPGCYPTPTLLGLLPLLKAGLVEPDETIKVNALSGTTGLSKDKQELAEHIERTGDIHTYKVGRVHQHVPEIEQQLDGRKIFFSPAVGPYKHGIIAWIDLKLKSNIYDYNVQEVLEEAYAVKPQVSVYPLGSELPTKTSTVRTDNCHLGIAAANRELQIVGSIDNLGRGAAGAGVLAMNLAFGFPETAGLRIA